jgi:hypothetical protein
LFLQTLCVATALLPTPESPMKQILVCAATGVDATSATINPIAARLQSFIRALLRCAGESGRGE